MASEDSNDIIDNGEIQNLKPSFKSIIKWWEKKRLLFNFAIVGICIYYVYTFWNFPMTHIIGQITVIQDTALFILVINCFFTVGWLSEVILFYTFKPWCFSAKVRWVLFSLGTLFGLFITSTYYVLKLDLMFY